MNGTPAALRRSKVTKAKGRALDSKATSSDSKEARSASKVSTKEERSLGLASVSRSLAFRWRVGVRRGS